MFLRGVWGVKIWEKYGIDTTFITTVVIPYTFYVPGSLGLRGRYYYYPCFIRQENLGRERLNNLPEITQPAHGRAEI